MESQKRAKSNNFSADEKRILTELVLKYQHIVENKRTDASTNKDKLRGWVRLAEEFNSISTYCFRTHLVLKCCWENIKRQSKKDQAETKKKLFMTGGGKPPAPSSSSQSGSGAIVEAILGPALSGLPNEYDSNAIINENIENSAEVEGEKVEVWHILEDNLVPALSLEQDNKNTNIVKDFTSVIEEGCTPKGILKESNVGENAWCSWTPKSLKMPLSESLKVSTQNEDWLKRRRPTRNDSSSDVLTQEKIKLVKVLQENAVRESSIRIAILEEQLKQEKLKTQKLADEN